MKKKELNIYDNTPRGLKSFGIHKPEEYGWAVIDPETGGLVEGFKHDELGENFDTISHAKQAIKRHGFKVGMVFD